MRLQTKFLLSLLTVSLGLTCASLLVVHAVLQKEIQREIFADLESSVLIFQHVQHQHELNLSRSAGQLANLPTLKALMTTRDKVTIQDASADLWRLADSDLFALEDRSGKLVALHAKGAGVDFESAQASMDSSLANGEPIHWWLKGGRLYEVFVKPVYFGTPAESNLLGFLSVGYEINANVAADVGRIANSYVAFQGGNTIVVSNLSAEPKAELIAQLQSAPGQLGSGTASLQLHGEKFLLTSLSLGRSDSAPIRLFVLRSYDQGAAILRRLNRLLLTLGVAAIVGGSVIVVLISRTFTKPLKNLVSGVRSLERGDFAYPLKMKGDDEVTEVTSAFDRMRQTLRSTQQKLLESERLATIGQMAASVSHDLRHSLTAVEANAEFLCEASLDAAQREELYQEIRTGVNQMTDLIDSLLEFSKTRESLQPAYSNLEDSVRRAIHAVRMHPDFERVPIELSCEGSSEGWFDIRKLERVFYNLLRNACEALPSQNGVIRITIRPASGNRILVRFADNGIGIPEPVRDKLFQPFVSYGKENGTGLGLAVVQKIVQDHGGSIAAESTSETGTVFSLVLPVDFPSTAKASDDSVATRDHQ